MAIEPERLLTLCPVCGSKRIEQEVWDRFSPTDGIRLCRARKGSYCKDCGACNIFNCKSQASVEDELRRIFANIKIQQPE